MGWQPNLANQHLLNLLISLWNSWIYFLILPHCFLPTQPPQGLLPVLDEESKNAQATDAAFVKKCDNIHRKHPSYDMAKLSYPAFTVRHYTGAVSCST